VGLNCLITRRNNSRLIGCCCCKAKQPQFIARARKTAPDIRRTLHLFIVRHLNGPPTDRASDRQTAHGAPLDSSFNARSSDSDSERAAGLCLPRVCGFASYCQAGSLLLFSRSFTEPLLFTQLPHNTPDAGWLAVWLVVAQLYFVIE
jgi:hypothetical protein